MLEVYDLRGKFLRTQERKAFYKEIKEEFKRTGEITKQVKSVRILLMNSDGRIYIQKRSEKKKENPELYDKTVGGHVLAGYPYDVTLTKECSEELGFAATVVPIKDFMKVARSIDLRVVGIFRKVEFMQNFLSIRVTQERDEFIQPYKSTFYIGYYDGPIHFLDGEAMGIEVFTLERLMSEMKNHPYSFTEDLKYMVKKYKRFLKPIK